jgi:cytoskeletal protein CcmA (bactofilin family)
MKEKEKKGEADGSLNIIGRGTEIQGNITATGDMRVEGRIKGTITCKARLVLSPEGVVEGNIDAVQATIAGDVKGTVVARQLLHIQETGKVLGDIFTEKLIVQLGAFFSGNCRMGKVEGTTGQALKGANPATAPVSGKAVEGLKPGNEA